MKHGDFGSLKKPMIPYLFWILCVIVIAFLMDQFECDVSSTIIVCGFITVGFVIYLTTCGWTEESRMQLRIADQKQSAIDNAPVTTTKALGNGCTINYYYGNGVKSEYTTKFVRCEKSDVETEHTWSCGSGKTQKTCRSTISTVEDK